MRVVVIGGGLAGSEAAWQIASAGLEVELVEMRPEMPTPVHQSDRLAELVCSNSLRSDAPGNAVGLLKREMEALDSLIIRCARASAVPAGSALAVDRQAFSWAVTMPWPGTQACPSAGARSWRRLKDSQSSPPGR